MRELSTSEREALFSLSSDLDVAPKTLAAEIQFESGWNPQIKNPRSSASGLIQFMDATARGMGFPGGSAELVRKFPTVETQLLGPVRRYLQMWAPFPTDQSLFMAVFYPAYRRVRPDKPFPRKVQEANPGIVTVQDYLDHVWSRVGDIEL